MYIYMIFLQIVEGIESAKFIALYHAYGKKYSQHIVHLIHHFHLCIYPVIGRKKKLYCILIVSISNEHGYKTNTDKMWKRDFDVHKD